MFVYYINLYYLDLFIGIAPIYHPTRENYTFFHSSYGADVLTIQAEDIAIKCKNNFHTNIGACDMHIGVYGFINTTFSLLVTVNDGFNSPIRLFDQIPQSGSVSVSQYAYYQYTLRYRYNICYYIYL